MSGEINVISRTQLILVEPYSGAVSIINAGPQGPGGSGWGPWHEWINPRFGDFDVNDWDTGLVETYLDGNVTKWGRYRVRGGEEIQYESAVAIRNPGSGAGLIPPSGMSLGSDSVIFELPFPRLENVISDSDIFGDIVQTFASLPPAFGDYGQAYLGMDGVPYDMISVSPLITPIYSTGDWADSEEDGGETWRRFVMPVSSYTNKPWRWDDLDPVVEEAKTNPSFWSWRGIYLGDPSAEISGGDEVTTG